MADIKSETKTANAVTEPKAAPAPVSAAPAARATPAEAPGGGEGGNARSESGEGSRAGSQGGEGGSAGSQGGSGCEARSGPRRDCPQASSRGRPQGGSGAARAQGRASNQPDDYHSEEAGSQAGHHQEREGRGSCGHPGCPTGTSDHERRIQDHEH